MNQALVAARKAAGLTQVAVSKQAGISATHYAQMELGWKTPSLRVALRLAAVLGRSVEDLWPELAAEARSAVDAERTAV